MSNIDTIGNLLKKSNTKDISKKVISMDKIFNNYKSSKKKLVIHNPYFDVDPKNYIKAKHKENLKKHMKGL
tara:strand:+ start:492 stop:704 length:213 start_codon:yes stop_codon:yes gene_type:complete